MGQKSLKSYYGSLRGLSDNAIPSSSTSHRKVHLCDVLVFCIACIGVFGSTTYLKYHPSGTNTRWMSVIRNQPDELKMMYIGVLLTFLSLIFSFISVCAQLHLRNKYLSSNLRNCDQFLFVILCGMNAASSVFLTYPILKVCDLISSYKDALKSAEMIVLQKEGKDACERQWRFDENFAAAVLSFLNAVLLLSVSCCACRSVALKDRRDLHIEDETTVEDNEDTTGNLKQPQRSQTPRSTNNASAPSSPPAVQQVTYLQSSYPQPQQLVYFPYPMFSSPVLQGFPPQPPMYNNAVFSNMALPSPPPPTSMYTPTFSTPYQLPLLSQPPMSLYNPQTDYDPP